MTIELFMYLFTIGSAFSSLLTQACKKTFTGVSSNILALVSAAIVGIFGSVFSYLCFDIDFSAQNIICIGLMAVCIWIGSMVSYDKVLQTIKQLKG
jgi:VIT1/CCC1 family predicted Fe2+/Mn2+ transporter